MNDAPRERAFANFGRTLRRFGCPRSMTLKLSWCRTGAGNTSRPCSLAGRPICPSRWSTTRPTSTAWPSWRTGVPNVRYLSGGGQGFARAANLGAFTSEKPYVVFVNPDCRPSPEQLLALVRGHRRRRGSHLPRRDPDHAPTE